MDCNQRRRRGLDVVANVKDAKLLAEGYNATDTYEDLVKADVVDAVKVVRPALPERFVHRIPTAGHRNHRRGDPRK
jgi:chaperonin GroEL (HSP60 family)